MKIAAIADIHGNLETYEWLAEIASDRNVDALVLAGDLLGAAESFETVEREQHEQSFSIIGILRPSFCPVLYVMGNDDWVDMPPAGSWASLHLKRLDVGEFNYVGYQHTPYFMGGPNERTEEEIERELISLSELLDSRTILVTHGPACGTLDNGYGSSSLADLLKSVSVHAHIHGHIHSAFGRFENRFNVAAGLRRRAMLIDLGLLEHEVIESA